MSNDDPRDGRARLLEMPGNPGMPGPPGAPGASGDPTRSPLALTLLDGLRAGRSWLQLAADLGLMPGEVYTELLPLVAARLLVFEGGEFQPTL